MFNVYDVFVYIVDKNINNTMMFQVNEAPLDRKVCIYDSDSSPSQLSHIQLVPGRLWPVCLPDITKSYSSEKTWVAGWGITKTKFIRVSRDKVGLTGDDLTKLTLAGF